MKIEYDQQADAMYIRLRAGTVAESEEIRPGVVFDYDVEGKVLGIEMLDVSERTDNPRELAMELVGGGFSACQGYGDASGVDRPRSPYCPIRRLDSSSSC